MVGDQMPSRRKPKAVKYQLPTALAGEEIVSLDDAEDIAGTSREVIEKVLAQYIIPLSNRRKGIRLKHVLRLTP
jgi:hypothetical protein